MITAHVDTAHLGTVFTDPAVIVPAPPTGFAVAVVSWAGDYVAGATGWLPADASPSLYYVDDPFDAQFPALNSAVGMPAGPAPVNEFAHGAGDATSTDPTNVDGKAIVYGTGTGDPSPTGPIVTSTLGDGGVDYAPGDTGTVTSNGYGAPAEYVIDTVDGGGAVLTYHLTAPGDGYPITTSPISTAAGGSQPGAGTGFSINVTAVPPASGDLYLTVVYFSIALH